MHRSTTCSVIRSVIVCLLLSGLLCAYSSAAYAYAVFDGAGHSDIRPVVPERGIIQFKFAGTDADTIRYSFDSKEAGRDHHDSAFHGITLVLEDGLPITSHVDGRLEGGDCTDKPKDSGEKEDQSVPVPEPSGILLAGAGLVAAWLFLRRSSRIA